MKKTWRVQLKTSKVTEGKAIVAVERKSMRGCCYKSCIFYGLCNYIACRAGDRKDGKNVIFKIVNL